MSGDSSSSKRISLPIYTVDAFTDRAFYGNPAAVCLVEPGRDLTDEQMQRIGAEMNLSETAFVKLDQGDFANANSFGLRWFTPTSEVDLCGHATLASTAVLFQESGNKSEEITFSSRSGPLIVKRAEDGKMSLNFPLNVPSPKDHVEVKSLLQVAIEDQSLIQDVQLSKTGKLLVRLNDNVTRGDLEKLKPAVDKMVASEPSKVVKGLGITLKGSRENGCMDSNGQVYDFVSRYFCPWFGIPEDPVTGAWHTVLAAYWAKVLGKQELYAHQCSSRGGDLWLEVEDERVTLTGSAVVNLRGTFTL